MTHLEQALREVANQIERKSQGALQQLTATEDVLQQERLAGYAAGLSEASNQLHLFCHELFDTKHDFGEF